MREDGESAPHAFSHFVVALCLTPSPHTGCGKSTLAATLAGKPPSRPPPQTAGCMVWVRVSEKKERASASFAPHDAVPLNLLFPFLSRR